MKRLIVLVAIVIFYTACDQNKVPKGLIEREKMLDVMVDMQLTDAYLNQVYNPDTMKMQAHSRYNYIFKKFNTDSANFSNSLKYYSKDPVALDSMFSQVYSTLARLQEKLKPKRTKQELDDSVKLQSQKLYNYMFGKFKIDSSKVGVNLNYYSLDAKALFKKYNMLSDSLVRLKDSVNVKPKQVRELKKLKEAKDVKNDLPKK